MAIDDGIYDWPDLFPNGFDATEHDMAFASWAHAVRDELAPVYDFMWRPLPDDPRLLDAMVTSDIDGWLPRVSALAVRAEYWLSMAKFEKWPSSENEDGKKVTVSDREAKHATLLAPYRYVRDELDTLAHRMVDRVRWGQSVRKQQESANSGY